MEKIKIVETKYVEIGKGLHFLVIESNENERIIKNSLEIVSLINDPTSKFGLLFNGSLIFYKQDYSEVKEEFLRMTNILLMKV